MYKIMQISLNLCCHLNVLKVGYESFGLGEKALDLELLGSGFSFASS